MTEPAINQEGGEDAAATGSESTAVYEIRLHGTLAESLRRQFPTAAVVTTRTETVLYRQVERPAELDALITQLQSLGLVLTEVQQVDEPGGPAVTQAQKGTP